MKVSNSSGLVALRTRSPILRFEVRRRRWPIDLGHGYARAVDACRLAVVELHFEVDRAVPVARQIDRVASGCNVFGFEGAIRSDLSKGALIDSNVRARKAPAISKVEGIAASAKVTRFSELLLTPTVCAGTVRNPSFSTRIE